MMMRIFGSTVMILVLAGCVSTSPDVLLSTNEPLGVAKNEGKFPVIGHVPRGQTSQITPTQRTILKDQLKQDSQIGQERAAVDQGAAYKAEIDALKKLAGDNRKALKEQIEGSSVQQ